MNTVKLDEPGEVVTFERGETYVLVEHEGEWFWVPERFVERAEPVERGGTATVVKVDREAGVVTYANSPGLTNEQKAIENQVRDWLAKHPEALPSPPPTYVGGNRKARRAEKARRR